MPKKDTGSGTSYIGQAFNVMRQVSAWFWRVLQNASFWTAAATITIAVATIFYTVYAKRQWKVMDAQLGVLQNQLEITDRPWIRAIPHVESPITFRDNGDLSINIGFDLTNVGRSVATDVTVYAGAFVPQWEGNEHFTKPLERQAQLCGKIHPKALTIAIFPDETKKSHVGLRISREEMEANIVPPPPGMPNPLPPGKRTDPIIFGCVDYRISSLPKHHQTGFIYDIVRTDPQTPNVPYLIVIGQDLPIANINLERWGFGGDYAN